MKISKFRPTGKKFDLITFEDESIEWFEEIYKLLVSDFGAVKKDVVQGLDQVYIDLEIMGKRLTISWDSASGTEIDCEDSELRENLFSRLSTI